MTTVEVTANQDKAAFLIVGVLDTVTKQPTLFTSTTVLPVEFSVRYSDDDEIPFSPRFKTTRMSTITVEASMKHLQLTRAQTFAQAYENAQGELALAALARERDEPGMAALPDLQMPCPRPCCQRERDE